MHAGWTLGLALPDGGPIPDGGYQLAYIGTSGIPDTGATATSSAGSALFYNIDPSITDFVAVTATNADAGSCVPVNSTLGFTGRLFVAEEGITAYSILLSAELPAAVCPAVAVAPVLPACASGTPSSFQAIGLPTPPSTYYCGPSAGISITAVDGTGFPIPGAATTTDENGRFGLCAPQNAPFSVAFAANTYSAELAGFDAGAFAFQLPAIAAQAPADADPNLAVVAIQIYQQGASNYLCPLSGWSFGLELPSGEPVWWDGGYQLAYTDLDGTADPSATGTSGWGTGFIYNIDPTVSSFYVATATNPNEDCVQDNGVTGFTGRVFVAPGSETIFPAARSALSPA